MKSNNFFEWLLDYYGLFLHSSLVKYNLKYSNLSSISGITIMSLNVSQMIYKFPRSIVAVIRFAEHEMLKNWLIAVTVILSRFAIVETASYFLQ